MKTFLGKLSNFLKNPLQPDLELREQVKNTLSKRSILPNEEWKLIYFHDSSVTTEFIGKFRELLNKSTEFDFSAALPSDKLEDIGWCIATWGDSWMDFIEYFFDEYKLNFKENINLQESYNYDTVGGMLLCHWDFLEKSNQSIKRMGETGGK